MGFRLPPEGLRPGVDPVTHSAVNVHLRETLMCSLNEMFPLAEGEFSQSHYCVVALWARVRILMARYALCRWTTRVQPVSGHYSARWQSRCPSYWPSHSSWHLSLESLVDLLLLFWLWIIRSQDAESGLQAWTPVKGDAKPWEYFG